MAHTVNVNFKLDEDVKKRMERACTEMGLSMSAAFTMFAKKSAGSIASRLRFRLIHSIRKVTSSTWRASCRM